MKKIFAIIIIFTALGAHAQEDIKSLPASLLTFLTQTPAGIPCAQGRFLVIKNKYSYDMDKLLAELGIPDSERRQKVGGILSGYTQLPRQQITTNLTQVHLYGYKDASFPTPDTSPQILSVAASSTASHMEEDQISSTNQLQCRWLETAIFDGKELHSAKATRNYVDHTPCTEVQLIERFQTFSINYNLLEDNDFKPTTTIETTNRNGAVYYSVVQAGGLAGSRKQVYSFLNDEGKNLTYYAYYSGNSLVKESLFSDFIKTKSGALYPRVSIFKYYAPIIPNEPTLAKEEKYIVLDNSIILGCDFDMSIFDPQKLSPNPTPK